MSTYVRCTNSESPVSDWGHAMLCDDYGKIKNYGKYLYTFDGCDAPHVVDLWDEIVAAWDNDCEHGFTGDFGNSITDEDYWRQIPSEEIAGQFNPLDIVDCAEAWDSDLVQWIWERILEPRGIMAVRTYNGAIVFDESLLMLQGKEDFVA